MLSPDYRKVTVHQEFREHVFMISFDDGEWCCHVIKAYGGDPDSGTTFYVSEAAPEYQDLGAVSPRVLLELCIDHYMSDYPDFPPASKLFSDFTSNLVLTMITC